jgi:hypothetical protein
MYLTHPEDYRFKPFKGQRPLFKFILKPNDVKVCGFAVLEHRPIAICIGTHSLLSTNAGFTDINTYGKQL